MNTRYEIKTNDGSISSFSSIAELQAWARGGGGCGHIAEADSGQLNFSWRKVQECYEVVVGAGTLLGQYDSLGDAAFAAKGACDAITGDSGTLSISWRKVTVVTGPDTL